MFVPLLDFAVPYQEYKQPPTPPRSAYRRRRAARDVTTMGLREIDRRPITSTPARSAGRMRAIGSSTIPTEARWIAEPGIDGRPPEANYNPPAITQADLRRRPTVELLRDRVKDPQILEPEAPR